MLADPLGTSGRAPAAGKGHRKDGKDVRENRSEWRRQEEVLLSCTRNNVRELRQRRELKTEGKRGVGVKREGRGRCGARSKEVKGSLKEKMEENEGFPWSALRCSLSWEGRICLLELSSLTSMHP